MVWFSSIASKYSVLKKQFDNLTTAKRAPTFPLEQSYALLGEGRGIAVEVRFEKWSDGESSAKEGKIWELYVMYLHIIYEKCKFAELKNKKKKKEALRKTRWVKDAIGGIE